MFARPDIYRTKAKMCRHLVAAVGDDLEARQRAINLAQKWEEMAREAEQSENRKIQMLWQFTIVRLRMSRRGDQEQGHETNVP